MLKRKPQPDELERRTRTAKQHGRYLALVFHITPAGRMEGYSQAKQFPEAAIPDVLKLTAGLLRQQDDADATGQPPDQAHDDDDESSSSDQPETD